MLHSGDTILRLLSFLLIFSNAGRAYSLDSILLPEKQAGTMWAHRLMQLQIAAVYLHTVLWKLKGEKWRNGEAVYYALNLKTHRRNRIPELLYRPIFFRFLSYSTLLVEGALGLLVWFPRFRYWVLGAGVIFHLSLDYFMRMHLFQWIMIVSLLVFVDSADVRPALELVQSLIW